jgi:hypothetical protein
MRRMKRGECTDHPAFRDVASRMKQRHRKPACVRVMTARQPQHEAMARSTDLQLDSLIVLLALGADTRRAPPGTAGPCARR